MSEIKEISQYDRDKNKKDNENKNNEKNNINNMNLQKNENCIKKKYIFYTPDGVGFDLNFKKN